MVKMLKAKIQVHLNFQIKISKHFWYFKKLYNAGKSFV